MIHWQKEVYIARLIKILFNCGLPKDYKNRQQKYSFPKGRRWNTEEKEELANDDDQEIRMSEACENVKTYISIPDLPNKQQER